MTKETYFLVTDHNGDEYAIEASCREEAVIYFKETFPSITIVKIRRFSFFKAS